jgi:ribonuclease BN (tRNA processing enzyme)
VIENAQNADVLIHDAQYTDEELPSHKGWGHSSWQQAVAVAKEANVKQLILYHHDPARSDDAMSQLEADAQGQFSNTLAARQGMEIDIPASY